MRNFPYCLLAVVMAACSPNASQTASTVGSAAGTTSPVRASTVDDTFGGAITLDRSTVITVSEAMNNPDRHNKPLLLSGTIDDVCQNKGCWMVVTDGDQQMRVTFKDYAFFVPKDVHGRRVLIEGVVSEEEVSEESAQHYASESRNESERQRVIQGPQKIVTMEATSVAIAHER